VTIFSGGATQQGLQRLSTLILLGGAVKTHSSPYEAVRDTNVLVSAALNDDKPYRVLSLAETGEIVSVTSPAIVDEFEDVLLRDRLPFTPDQVTELVEKVLLVSRVIEPRIDLTVVDDDPDDDKILECAVAGTVDCIVSGDSHLLQLGRHETIEIYSPSSFLTQI
jgi:putative PIN family toxin of toxin-antitoxin system